MKLQTSRVLIVDHQPPNAQLFVSALGGHHEVLVAASAQRALELAPSADLVLLDDGIPDMGGLEVCRRLKADEATKRIPVIFVTALEPEENHSRGLEAGAADCIVRPINAAIVRARVRTHLELGAARDLLERIATHDAPTGLANRRRFDEATSEEWRRSMRFSQVLTIALADLDDFKAFTDRHGQGGGDTCLRLVAEALQRLCRRPGELVARYGGEGFAFLLPDVDLEGARRFVQRVLVAVEGVEVEGLTRKGALSMSVGAVTLIPSPLNSLDDAIRAADQGLHKAKESGRRRGVVHGLETGEVFDVLPGE